MERIFSAPAKINLCLHVLGKRPDGYHDLAMLMQRVSLFDRIAISLRPAGGVQVRCDRVPLVDGEENIAARAARRMLMRADRCAGVDIVIDKQIPVAAGLGGGSSDAATVLLALNEMLGLELSRDELMVEGAQLGADVPFFIFQDTAWATGIGDGLQKVEKLPELHYVLVNPGFAVSTAWVYGNLVLTSKNDAAKLPRFSGALAEVVALLHNDLEQVTLGRYPVVQQVKDRLLAAGAAGALMSGSGPTVFGLFADEATAQRACARMADEPGWRAFVVRPV